MKEYVNDWKYNNMACGICNSDKILRDGYKIQDGYICPKLKCENCGKITWYPLIKISDIQTDL